jgi:hypothetical protein
VELFFRAAAAMPESLANPFVQIGNRLRADAEFDQMQSHAARFHRHCRRVNRATAFPQRRFS